MRRPGWRACGGLLAIAAGILSGAAGAAAQGDETIDRLLSEGSALEREGDREGALAKYALLSDQFPEAPAAAESLLRQAIGNLALEREEAAEAAARALIRDHPRRPQAAGAHTLLGRIQFAAASDGEELDRARETLENAVLLFPRSAYLDQPWRAEAAVLGARVALRQGRDAEAARALVDVVDLEPRSYWTAAARLELAALLQDQGDWPLAGGLLQEVVERAGESDEYQALAALARGRLALAHRLGVRPAAGQERWQSARLAGGAPEKPETVAAHPDGRVAVVGAKGATVVLDPAGEMVARVSRPEARRASWAGEELLVATPDAVATYPGRRNLQFAAPTSEKKSTLQQLAAVEPAPFGGWLVLTSKPPRVLLYQARRRLHDELVTGKGREPADLASDRRGRLLVLDSKARSVTRFSAGDTRGERLIGGGWERAEALAVDPAGNIYVLDRGARRVEIFDRAGKRLTSLGPGLPGGLALERPADLSVDLAGRLWIADTKQGLIVLE